MIQLQTFSSFLAISSASCVSLVFYLLCLFWGRGERGLGVSLWCHHLFNARFGEYTHSSAGPGAPPASIPRANLSRLLPKLGWSAGWSEACWWSSVTGRQEHTCSQRKLGFLSCCNERDWYSGELWVFLEVLERTEKKIWTWVRWFGEGFKEVVVFSGLGLSGNEE